MYKLSLSGALLAMIAVSPLYASGMLSFDEMQQVQGGSTQIYCKSFICGAGDQTCKEDAGKCNPSDPDSACNNSEIKHTTVQDCGSLTANGHSCNQGSQSECPNSSGLYKCSCNTYNHNCNRTFDSHYYYNPCN